MITGWEGRLEERRKIALITGGEEDGDYKRGGRWRLIKRGGRWRLEEGRKMAVIIGGEEDGD